MRPPPPPTCPLGHRAGQSRLVHVCNWVVSCRSVIRSSTNHFPTRRAVHKGFDSSLPAEFESCSQPVALRTARKNPRDRDRAGVLAEPLPNLRLRQIFPQGSGLPRKATLTSRKVTVAVGEATVRPGKLTLLTARVRFFSLRLRKAAFSFALDTVPCVPSSSAGGPRTRRANHSVFTLAAKLLRSLASLGGITARQ